VAPACGAATGAAAPGGTIGPVPRAGPGERLPAALVDGSLAIGPSRGNGLEAVLAEGREIDRQVEGAEEPLGEA